MLLSEYIEKHGAKNADGVLACIVGEEHNETDLYTYIVKLSPSGKLCDWGNHPGCTITRSQWVPTHKLQIIEIIEDHKTHNDWRTLTRTN
jgi:hypothetical protein